jgi:hypothetical protein
LATNGLAINLENVFSQHLLLKFLDTRFRRQERRPLQPITLPKPPQDIKQLQQFLGKVNFYRRFLPNCAQVLRPLTDLLKGGAKTLGVDCFRSEGFPKYKMPTGGDSATPTPCPKC